MRKKVSIRAAKHQRIKTSKVRSLNYATPRGGVRQ